MAIYYMHQDYIDCEINVNLLSFEMCPFIDELIYQMECSIRSIDSVLDKYSWDGKKPYEHTHSKIIKDARESKVILLLKIRKLKKLKEII